MHVADEDLWKYRRIADDLRSGIRAGTYAPGSRLPSRAELMKTYGVSLGPVTEAVRMLRDEGLIRTEQGAGTYVCDPLPEGQPSSEYEVVMARVDDLADEVRQLRERMAAAERRQVAGPS